MYGRRDFFDEFGHGKNDTAVEKYHSLFAKPESQALAFQRMFAAGPPYPVEVPCGWWWCFAKADNVNWKGLAGALRVLRDLGIDPHGPAVADVGHTYTSWQSWGKERKDYEVLKAALDGCASSLTLDSDANRLRSEWLGHLSTLMDNAARCAPDRVTRGRPVDQALRKVSVRYGCCGWPPEAVAAALVLTGVHKLFGNSSWTLFRHSIAERWSKMGEEDGKKVSITPVAAQIRKRLHARKGCQTAI